MTHRDVLSLTTTLLVALAWPVLAAAQAPSDAAARSVLRVHAQNAALRSLALEQMARAGDAAATDALRQDAQKGAGEAQHAALVSLARLGEQDAASRLAKTMGDDPDLETVTALAASHARAAGPALVLALGASKQEVRAAAAIGVGRLGYARGAGALRAALGDDWGEVRGAAAAALWRLGDASALPVAQGLLSSPRKETALAAADAWAPEHQGPWVAEIEPMLHYPLAEVRHAAAERLAILRRAQAIAVLQADLSPDVPADVRVSAARLTQACATPREREWLESLLADPQPEVQIAAAGALLRLAAP